MLASQLQDIWSAWPKQQFLLLNHLVILFFKEHVSLVLSNFNNVLQCKSKCTTHVNKPFLVYSFSTSRQSTEEDLFMKMISQVVSTVETESSLLIGLSLCRRRLSVGGACAVDGRSHTAPLSVRHSRSESDTGPAPRERGSSGVGVGSGL